MSDDDTAMADVDVAGNGVTDVTEEKSVSDNEQGEEEKKKQEEKPTVLGKRQRKTVERFKAETIVQKRTVELVEGKGTQLKNIHNAHFMLSKLPIDSDFLKNLHKLLYNSIGQKNKRRRAIGAFSGLVYKDVGDRDKKRNQIGACTKSFLDACLRNLDVADRLETTTREDKADALLKFLECPKPSGNTEKQKKKRTPKKVVKKKSPKKKTKAKGAIKPKAMEKLSDESDNSNESDVSSDEEESDDDKEAKPPPKKKAKKEAKPPPKKKAKKVVKEKVVSDDDDSEDGDGDADAKEEDKPKGLTVTTQTNPAKAVHLKDVELSDTVEDVKDELEALESIPSASQILKVGDTVLGEGALSDYIKGAAEVSLTCLSSDITDKISEILETADPATVTIKNIRKEVEAKLGIKVEDFQKPYLKAFIITRLPE